MATLSGWLRANPARRRLVMSEPVVTDGPDAVESSVALGVTEERPDDIFPAFAPRRGLGEEVGRLVFRRHYTPGLIDPDVEQAISWISGAADRAPPTRPATTALPVATLLASVLGLDLTVEAPVDARALAGARSASELMSEWFGWHPVDICAGEVVEVAPEDAFVSTCDLISGLYWSRGLDSTATLLALVREGRAPGLLVAVDWVDPPLAGPDQQAIMDSTAAACLEIGVPLVRVSTNARQFTDPVVPWDFSYGTVLAACALQLDGLCRSVGIASTFPEDDDRPHGSHARLDPLWSSALVDVAHLSPVAGGRIDKARVVASDPSALGWLKVCWERAGDGNCGRCTKCLLTLTAFQLVGAGDDVAELFDGPLTPEAIDAVVPAPTVIPLILEVLDGLDCLETSGAYERALAVAWRTSLGRIGKPHE